MWMSQQYNHDMDSKCCIDDDNRIESFRAFSFSNLGCRRPRRCFRMLQVQSLGLGAEVVSRVMRWPARTLKLRRECIAPKSEALLK